MGTGTGRDFEGDVSETYTGILRILRSVKTPPEYATICRSEQIKWARIDATYGEAPL